ncbi:hypothetical protein Tco_1408065 [Tanacetum coccineum]
MLQICPKLPNQQFEELPFEETILIFLRDLGHSGEIKMITDVNVNKLHQPWRSFAAVINKCLSGMKIHSCMVPFCLMNRWNEDIENSESYKEYYVIASGAEPPKTKASVKKKQVGSEKTKTPPITKGKILKTSAKAAKPAKKKQPAKTSKDKGLTVLSKVALTEAEQIKLATKRSLTETHSSHTSSLGVDEGTGSIPKAPNVPTYRSDDEQISWKSSDDEDNVEVTLNDEIDEQYVENQDDDDEQTDSDNDGDDFVHPKFSILDE